MYHLEHFLSGGLDSSIIVGLLSREVGEIRTFSIGFDEKEFDETFICSVG